MDHEQARLEIYGETTFEESGVGGRWQVGETVAQIREIDGRAVVVVTEPGMEEFHDDHGNYPMAVGGFLRLFVQEVIDERGKHAGIDVERLLEHGASMRVDRDNYRRQYNALLREHRRCSIETQRDD